MAFTASIVFRTSSILFFLFPFSIHSIYITDKIIGIIEKKSAKHLNRIIFTHINNLNLIETLHLHSVNTYRHTLVHIHYHQHAHGQLQTQIVYTQEEEWLLEEQRSRDGGGKGSRGQVWGSRGGQG